jgi:dihydroxy-acid dehydratase
MAGHVSPEAVDGGPIAAVRNGDMITLDLAEGTVSLDLSDDDITRRVSEWKAPTRSLDDGVLSKYVRLVASASEGAVTIGARLGADA